LLEILGGQNLCLALIGLALLFASEASQHSMRPFALKAWAVAFFLLTVALGKFSHSAFIYTKF
jgi:hypothetical protein